MQKRSPWLLILTLTGLLHVGTNAQSVRLNEMVAVNATYSDEDGDTPDWFELRNVSAAAVDLNDWTVTDDPARPDRWRFPAIVLPGGAYLRVWASGKDRPRITALSHTNFKLSAGETLYLYDRQGERMDSLPGGTPPPGVAVGRLPTDVEAIRLFEVATPGAPNTTPSWLGALPADIEFSVDGGAVAEPFSLSLSGGPATAQIRFTLDASLPTTDSELYTTPIPIDSNTVVRAALFQTDYLPSPPQTKTYRFDPAHDLPVVSLVTEPRNFFDVHTGIYVLGNNHQSTFPYFGANFWRDWERPIHVTFQPEDGTAGVSFPAGVKIFGGWSRGHPQRSLSLFARGRYGAASFAYPFFSRLPFQEYQALVLRNTGNDFLQVNMRDIIITGLMRDADLETQSFRSCAVYLNGEYWGFYNLREKINEHFLAARYDLDPNEIDLLEANGATIHGDNADYLALLDFVATHDLSDDTHFAEIETQIDVDNYLFYFASQIYFDNNDWPGNNIKYWRPRNGKWRWIMFDLDFGMVGDDGPKLENNTLEFALATDGPSWPNPPWSTFLFRNAMRNTGFQHRFINRLCDEMNTRFRAERIVEHIDTLSAGVANEMERHLARWNGDWASWQQYLEWMRQYAHQRPAYMKGYVLDYFELPAYHTLHLTNHSPESGYLRLNSLTLEDADWSGDYFENVPVTLEAVARPGYAFSHWHGDVNTTDARLTLDLNRALNLTAVFTPSEPPTVVINEINYNSDNERPTDDWVELHNPTPEAIDLSGWSIRDNDDDHVFSLPSGTSLPAYGYLVVVRDQTAFSAYYPELTNVIGELDFGFGSDGDAVRLYDAAGRLHDEVVYAPTPPWPTTADGQGATLELIAPELDNALPASWADVNPYGSPGARNADAATPTDLSLVEKVRYFPNPSNGMLFLRFTLRGETEVGIQLYDIQGRRVRDWSVGRLSEGAHGYVYELDDLETGEYLLEICPAEGACVVRKWVKF